VSLAFDTGARPAKGDVLAHDVAKGLASRQKTLPAYLFYDTRGSALYERITVLPEYYLTRAEASIFRSSVDRILDRAAARANRPLTVVELGAGTCTKSELLLRTLLARQETVTFVPTDISRSALDLARRRLADALPQLDVRPLVHTHEEDLADLARDRRASGAAYLAMFIGSSIGNYPDADAVALLSAIRAALGPEAQLLLGTDLRKSPAKLLPAYDDAQGVTAAFNKNVLVRLNRELGARFDVERFRHVALWNDEASQIEMHLESQGAMDVHIDELGCSVHFDDRETIHTETCIKYDLPHIDRLLVRSGFSRSESFFDEGKNVALHLAHGVAD
jgi:L-histidine Nalpha-methyltransferase